MTLVEIIQDLKEAKDKIVNLPDEKLITMGQLIVMSLK